MLIIVFYDVIVVRFVWKILVYFRSELFQHLLNAQLRPFGDLSQVGFVQLYKSFLFGQQLLQERDCHTLESFAPFLDNV